MHNWAVGRLYILFKHRACCPVLIVLEFSEYSECSGDFLLFFCFSFAFIFLLFCFFLYYLMRSLPVISLGWGRPMMWRMEGATSARMPFSVVAPLFSVT